MANEQNLIPTTMRSENEARELGRKGGIASGEVRRRKKTMRESAQAALEAINSKTGRMYQDDAMIAAMARAMRGDINALAFLRDTVGEKPANDINLATPSGPLEVSELKSMSAEELRQMREELKNRQD